MRLRHLDLLRYGKFTDRRIDLPESEQDFHFILGPNEAGKSTTRSAIADLLYGIPARTSLAFVHAMPDMRLGGGLAAGRQGQGPVLDVQRTKGNKQTLRDAADQPLADNALLPFVGSTDRDFFHQMFSLDHARMVQGGRSILSASDNLGQILFQSAAGIASLGSVRDDLQAQADRLWSPRRAKDRAYYKAADDLDAATAALKQATVRTRDWTEAHAALQAAEKAHAALHAELADVRQQRARLERLRRVLPPLATLQALATRRADLGDVVTLPDDAATTLAQAERVVGMEQVAIDHQAGLLAAARAALQSIQVDDALLEAAAEITELDAQRLQYRAHATDLARRQAECDAQWNAARQRAAALGWPETDEPAVRARLPADAVRAALARAVREAGLLRQAADATGRAVRQKQAEIDAIEAAAGALPTAQASPLLDAALLRAQKLGDAAAAGSLARRQRDRQALALDTALAALGRWRVPLDTLQAMTPPSPAHLQALAQAELQDAAQARGLADRIAQLQQQADQAALALRQYEAGHDTVGDDELQQARQQRDAVWSALKSDPVSLPGRSAEFELLVDTTDALADRRHATAQEASELRNRRDAVAQRALDLQHRQAEQADLQARIAQRAADWRALAETCGLGGLPLDAAAPWLAARSAALDAAARLADAEAEVERQRQAVADACTALADALGQAAGQAADRETGQAVMAGDPLLLERLLRDGERQVQAAANAAGERAALVRQLADARRSLAALTDDDLAARAALAQWSTRWNTALAEAGFAAGADPAAVELQLAWLGELADALAAMQRIRVERIDKMQADLDRHAAAAQDLAARLRPDLVGQPAQAIAVALAAGLAAAREQQQRVQRLQAEVAQAEALWQAATLRQDQARASIAPLMLRTGAASAEALAAAIARSDQARVLQAEMAAAERAIVQGGDGLDLARLQHECAGADPARLVADLDALLAREDDLVARLSAASAQRQTASAALQAIAGSADAAEAEARRQQALAAMAEAVERYVRVHTAARLLRWSIERYREVKQGPMLAAASAVFAQLTLGSFDRLIVDFEHDPPRLQGHRPAGRVVDIEGMSEGTQDQLFLALRLAALDMHLDHATALPFVADDLFINYDDDRAVGGLRALAALSRKTQVLFLSHHAHLLPLVRQVLGAEVNVVQL